MSQCAGVHKKFTGRELSSTLSSCQDVSGLCGN